MINEPSSDELELMFHDVINDSLPNGSEIFKQLITYLPDNFTPNRILLVVSNDENIVNDVLNNFPKSQIHIVDFDQNILNILQQIFKAKTNIYYHLKEIDNLDFDENSFEMVIAFDLLRYVHEKLSLYRQVYDLLKSNGVFLFSDITIDIFRIYDKEIQNLIQKSPNIIPFEIELKSWAFNNYIDCHKPLDWHFKHLRLARFKMIDVVHKNLLWSVLISTKPEVLFNYNSDALLGKKMISHNNIFRLYDFQAKTLNILKDFLPKIHHRDQGNNYWVFAQLLIKIRLNLESLNDLILKLIEDVRYKVTINVIYRSIIDDIINILYLHSFIDINDIEQKTLKNEIDILERDFIDAIITIVKSECAENEEHNLDNSFNLEEQLEQIQKDYSSLFDIPSGKIKNNRLLRSTSNPILISNLKQTNKLIGESAKIERIKMAGFATHEMLLQIFKYFSQFQHFSGQTHRITLSELSIDFPYYEKTFILIVNTAHLIVQLLDIEYKESYLNELDNELRAFLETEPN
ncbi:MAG: hypothetical protein JWQ34_3260 [Mucilaginibacter sp.]|uniref:class I SAM-dependent methyltransferase n=1 Tax=Mucilaginibacter sp. TaxID=1882438 RepID=UPI002631E142|nr:class I SAM-dependent methyltransferase [Mucilaginibacter sp.]MDB5005035.1 hypothetical protein [Mucilaginibacter sp.]